ncbi:MAG: peptide ABC transporter substrate-binding protein, partial [Chloroflexi bacterium]|nr:peptide ABC transporter substrate-binding protein [Chloroflexota bacterium]
MNRFSRLPLMFGVVAALFLGAIALGACGATPTPEVKTVEKVVTQIVEKEKVVEKAVQQTVVVAQTVVVEKEKAVEKVITATPTSQKVLRINLATYPDTIDPQKSSFVNEISHLKMIYEGLTRLDKDLNTVPAAAEKWEFSKDGKTLTFTLRKGLKYSDGTALDARRFAFSIKRNINPETAGEYAQITDEIMGAPEWRGADMAKTSKEDMAKLEATVTDAIAPLDAAGKVCTKDTKPEDCMTLKLTLSKPAPYFATIMGLWVTFPARAELITEGKETWWNSSKFQIGNGPFVLKNLEPFVRARFVPNPNYWRGKAKLDAIEYSYITDSAVGFQAYKNNEFDIVPLAAEDLKTVMADATMKAEANVYAGSCTFAVMFHQQKEPFTDPKVRQAFALALDREAWVRDVLQGLGAPTLTWIPPGFPGYKKDEKRWGFDAAAAKKAITDSKYGSVDKLPAVKLTFSDSPRNRTRYTW